MEDLRRGTILKIIDPNDPTKWTEVVVTEEATGYWVSTDQDIDQQTLVVDVEGELAVYYPVDPPYDIEIK